MSLPFIFDVAIGLIFIYLILSLLAAEIQELLATIFQWRAEHLRKSIENFMAGDVSNSNDVRVIQLVNDIYANPLIKSVNQQAKGVIANIPRRLTWGIGSVYRSINPRANRARSNDTVFGNGRHSGPSYIPPDVFASSLVDTLNLPTFAQKISTSRLDQFKAQVLEEIQNQLFQLEEQSVVDETLQSFLNLAYQAFAKLQAEFEQIIWNYERNQVTLDVGMSTMRSSLDKYIQFFQEEKPSDNFSDKALQNLQNIRQQSFADIEQTISFRGLRPTLQQVAGILDKGSDIYEEVSKTLAEKDSELYKNLENLTERLPEGLARNIMAIAKKTQLTVSSTQKEINDFRLEIEKSFNNSMERASGVYKRNAKGIAILIGILIATSSNADAFHMISRLSKDSALRATITENAGRIVLENRNNLGYVDINTLRSQTDEALNDIALPIGWSDANLQQQINWTRKQQRIFPFWRLITLIPGWIISGIAIGMGAPFWFDLLGKIVNVRNVGKSPSDRN